MVYNCIDLLRRIAYPATCILCGAPGQGQRDLCDGCLNDLPHNRHGCPSCALPLPPSSPPGTLCGKCLKQPPKFDRCLAALRYEPPVNHLIGGLKFRDKLGYGRLLAQLLGDHLAQRVHPLPQLIIPVPLHPARLKQRGFDQALELARPLSRRFAIPIDATSCRRVRATAPQSELDRKDRRRNIRGAFQLAAQLPAGHVAIVDDVVTTGSTVNELAHTLRRAGVSQVEVWAIARRALS